MLIKHHIKKLFENDIKQKGLSARFRENAYTQNTDLLGTCYQVPFWSIQEIRLHQHAETQLANQTGIPKKVLGTTGVLSLEHQLGELLLTKPFSWIFEHPSDKLRRCPIGNLRECRLRDKLADLEGSSHKAQHLAAVSALANLRSSAGMSSCSQSNVYKGTGHHRWLNGGKGKKKS